MTAAMAAEAPHAAPGRRSPRRGASRGAPPRPGTSVIVRVLAVCLMLVGAAGVYLGGRMLMAGLAGLQADLFLADWQARGGIPSERAAEVALAAAQRAVTWYPVAHAELLQREGRVLAWRSYARPVGDPEVEADRLRALAVFREAVAARPAWPHAWVGLAQAKRELGEPDAEFLAALRNALTYGHGRWEIQRDVARIGLLEWENLPMPDQGRVLEAASRTASDQRREASRLAPYLEYAGITRSFCIYQRALRRETNGLCPTR